MSTKSTIFFTNDNEHCYYEHSSHHFKDGKHIGDGIFLEIDKRNIGEKYEDSEDIIVEIIPGCQLYEIIESIPNVRRLLSTLIEWEKMNHLEPEHIEEVNRLLTILKPVN